MAHHKVYLGFLILAITAIHRVQMTCVFDSDFGFKLNCAFKKSSLFRVRNLGGIKAHVGLGFSVGDELGFDQSLTNLDTNKRRSASFTNGSPINSLASLNQQTQQKMSRPANNVQKNRLTVRQPSSSSSPLIAMQSVPTALPESATEGLALQSGRSQGSVMRQMQLSKPSTSYPPFKPIPPAKEISAPVPTSQAFAQYGSPNQNSRIQSAPVNQNRIGQTPNSNYVSLSAAPPRIVNGADQALRTIPAPVMASYPQFAAMPASISRISALQSDQTKTSMSVLTPQAYKNSVQIPVAQTMMNRLPNVGYGGNTISLGKLPSLQSPPAFAPQKPAQKIDNMIAYNVVSGNNGINDYSSQNSLHQKIAALSRATNISVETIEAAVRLRQNQLIQQMINAATTTPAPAISTTNTPRPPPPPPPPPPPMQTVPPKRYQPTTSPPQPTSKVMNAPKEYYPVGYDKNYDDNFVSKVDLPETSFYCGDQKHFPGLYGDEDLGCMVFHVCALTDDGLIMKSFLCPESTLFDQTILKCNWWFYVDCKSSKRLYDSNIPISKSYQLMKALTFFSSYKKDDKVNEQNVAKSSIEENRDGVNNAVKILQDQAQMHLPKVEIAEVNKSNDANRNSKYFTPVNANEVNSLSIVANSSENTSAEKEDRSQRSRGRLRASAERTSTEKSIVKSTSVERSVIKRRPHASYRVSPLRESEELDQLKSSEEVRDVASTTVSSQKVTIDEVTGSSANQIIKSDDPEKVHDTIVKMDEAIIGRA